MVSCFGAVQEVNVDLVAIVDSRRGIALGETQIRPRNPLRGVKACSEVVGIRSSSVRYILGSVEAG